MKTGKIKIKAKYFVKIKAVTDTVIAEETKEMVFNNSFSFDYIINSLTTDLNSGEFGYGWRLEGESAAI
jgi:hypothetical protein